MADYDGITIAHKIGVVSAWAFPHSTVQKHGGSYSIRLLPGRVYPPVWCACEADREQSRPGSMRPLAVSVK